ncbi:hypothetical protein FHS18_001500 [Paenibacillus phyllosphaerae]|uniref:Uncharacterized protein n=1 Tax=Paenibacillus phyllosphaerae TaxID=274593 RepID=A0A7W5AVI1_9BACL|nr:hypothetical protein [Paenibacillus phyllosphaerae]MBB3109448.1 hypothetical protein [Paenibacillus phyllosphaerae]
MKALLSDALGVIDKDDPAYQARHTRLRLKLPATIRFIGQGPVTEDDPRSL